MICIKGKPFNPNNYDNYYYYIIYHNLRYYIMNNNYHKYDSKWVKMVCTGIEYDEKTNCEFFQDQIIAVINLK